MLKVGDTFVSPTGPNARFPEREMRVVEVVVLGGEHWIDAEPVLHQLSDEFWHSTYRLDEHGQVGKEVQ